MKISPKLFFTIITIAVSTYIVSAKSKQSSYLKNIEGTWEEVDTIQGMVWREEWSFEREFKNTGVGNLAIFINDTLKYGPEPFVWMMHELEDGVNVIQIRLYKEKIEYPLQEIENITKNEIRFCHPNSILRKKH